MRVNAWSGSSSTAGATLLYNTSNEMYSMSSMINGIHGIRRIEEGKDQNQGPSTNSSHKFNHKLKTQIEYEYEYIDVRTFRNLSNSKNHSAPVLLQRILQTCYFLFKWRVLVYQTTSLLFINIVKC
jgi:hypothetical protein